MTHSEPSPVELVAALLMELDARAAGLWKLEGDVLAQIAFVPGRALPEEVARSFAEATRSVRLDQHSLGIVAAARTREVAVSRAASLPADSASGHWLQLFGASRSVAVPLLGNGGALAGVISVALASNSIDDHLVADRLRSAARNWTTAASS
jgi:hypothetical protein